jgi:hypothetical protein
VNHHRAPGFLIEHDLFGKTDIRFSGSCLSQCVNSRIARMLHCHMARP